jgi:hypothetical protein
MTSRRKFLIQGSLATTAMIVAKPFKTLAGPVFSSFVGNNSLVFLHTANLDSDNESKVIGMLNELRTANQGTVLLKATSESTRSTSLKYDGYFQASDVSLELDEFKIIRRGGLKIGIIGASKDESNVMEKVNAMASRLKNAEHCDVVVCLSQLGYINKNHIDDLTMASNSSNIDIIIGGHPDNVTKYPMIHMNSNKAEVIVDSSASAKNGIGTIQIDFNNRGKKQLISFNKKPGAAALA